MKIGIIGSGLVGATAAYALVLRGIGREIVLVDLNAERASAEADDIFHAVPFAHPMQVRSGSYADLKDSKIVIIAAGVGQRPGESRLELLGRNARIMSAIVPEILAYAPDSILLVATNPVDIMTHLIADYAGKLGVPSQRVLGSGTTLDTARFRALLGRNLGVDSQHIHAYVLGEHGDSEVLAWSLVSVGGIPLADYCDLRHAEVCREDREQIEDQVRNAAYHIINGKGATYYGIGSALARICEAILRDQRAILTVCTPVPEVEGVAEITLALPNLVGGAGILGTMYPINLNDEEHAGLENSARIIRQALDSLIQSGP